MQGARDELLALIDEEAARPAGAHVEAAAAAIRARGGADVAAILFYGSGLWQGPSADQVLDFYVLVDRLRAFEQGPAAALLNRILPPNVFYIEVPYAGGTLRAKYAVLRRDQFRRGASGRTPTPQVWARFAQPCRLVYCRDAAARDAMVAALADAVVTFHRKTLPLLGPRADARALWRRGLIETYARELRSEGATRAEAVYAAAPEVFARWTRLAVPLAGWPSQVTREGTIVNEIGKTARFRARAAARLARPLGKLVSLIRLMKAAFTFVGGVDYILWKIERHSGVRVEPTAFQRRHPLIAGWPLLWRLYRRGGFR